MTRASLAPLDPLAYAPRPERPVRAKVRHLAPDTEIQPHSHPWAQVAISISGVARITAGHSTYLVPAWRAVWIRGYRHTSPSEPPNCARCVHPKASAGSRRAPRLRDA